MSLLKGCMMKLMMRPTCGTTMLMSMVKVRDAPTEMYLPISAIENGFCMPHRVAWCNQITQRPHEWCSCWTNYSRYEVDRSRESSPNTPHAPTPQRTSP
jgi:hypothetical protein